MPIIRHIDFEPPGFAEFPRGPSILAGYASAVLDLQPLAYWRMGESSGPTLADHSGHDRHLTLEGSPQLAQTGAIARDPDTAVGFIAAAAGRLDPAFHFTAQQPFSLIAWFRATDSVGSILSCMANASPYRGWELSLNNGLPRLLLCSTWSSNAARVEAGTPIADDQWHLLAASSDGSSSAAGLSLSIDAQPSNLSVTHNSLTGSIVGSQPLRLASRATAGYECQSTLDEVAVFDRVLTQDQILHLHRIATLR